MKFTRSESLARLEETVSSGEPIIGAGAGTGISAKFAERGGVDLLIIYSSGRYRMNGQGSLAGLLYCRREAVIHSAGQRFRRRLSNVPSDSIPYGNANEIVVEMGHEVMLDVEGEDFHDPETDRALFGALRERLDAGVELIKRDAEINAESFVETLVTTLDEYMRETGRGPTDE